MILRDRARQEALHEVYRQAAMNLLARFGARSRSIEIAVMESAAADMARRMTHRFLMARRLYLTIGLLLIGVDIAAGMLNRPEPIGLDFHTYAAAARVGLQHGWSSIYDQRLVAMAQASLVPEQPTQPFLSPPPVAWLASLLAGLPYNLAFVVWSVATTLALAWAVAWSCGSRSIGRWLAAGLVLTPWWVLIADRVGQVVPLVAVGILVAWRMIREDRDVAAGLMLGLVLLKPNTAFLVPVALLAAGRKRTLISWLVPAGAGSILLVGTVGLSGLGSYVNELAHPPPGTNALSLEAAFGVGGLAGVGLRLTIIAVVIAAAIGLRSSPGLAIALGTVGSLLVTPYLHLSDLTLLAAAGLIVWQERPVILWRAPLTASWVLVNPLVATHFTPAQNRWPLFELAWLIALLASTWQANRQSRSEAKPSVESAFRWTANLGLPSAVNLLALRPAANPINESANRTEVSPPAA